MMGAEAHQWPPGTSSEAVMGSGAAHETVVAVFVVVVVGVFVVAALQL